MYAVPDTEETKLTEKEIQELAALCADGDERWQVLTRKLLARCAQVALEVVEFTKTVDEGLLEIRDLAAKLPGARTAGGTD